MNLCLKGHNISCMLYKCLRMIVLPTLDVLYIYRCQSTNKGWAIRTLINYSAVTALDNFIKRISIYISKFESIKILLCFSGMNFKAFERISFFVFLNSITKKVWIFCTHGRVDRNLYIIVYINSSNLIKLPYPLFDSLFMHSKSCTKQAGELE